MTINKQIIGIDPGITTGIAVFLDNLEEVKHYTVRDFDVTLLVIADLILDAKNKNTPTQIVLEDFIGGGFKTKETKYTLELIGGINSLSLFYKTPIVRQVPQKRLPFIQDVTTLYPKRTKHEQDAMAHILAYLYEVQKNDV